MPAAMPLGPIQVNSPLFLQVFLDSQRCPCGSRYRNREMQRVSRGGATLHQVFAICKRCRSPRVFEFDMTQAPRAGDQAFVDAMTAFLDGMQALKHLDYPRAEKRFLAALDEETGEPSFTAAHHQLGRVAFRTGRLEEAIRRFRRAALLQPLEIAHHEALHRAYRASGNVDAALAELAEVEDLKLRPGPPEPHPAFEP